MAVCGVRWTRGVGSHTTLLTRPPRDSSPRCRLLSSIASKPHQCVQIPVQSTEAYQNSAETPMCVMATRSFTSPPAALPLMAIVIVTLSADSVGVASVYFVIIKRSTQVYLGSRVRRRKNYRVFRPEDQADDAVPNIAYKELSLHDYGQCPLPYLLMWLCKILRASLPLPRMSLKVPKANNVQLFKEGYKVRFQWNTGPIT